MMSQRKKFLSFCVCVLLVIGVFGATTPFVSSLAPSAKAKASRFTYIDLTDIKTDKMYVLDWATYHVFIIRPRPEVLEQLDSLEAIEKWGEQPPYSKVRLDAEIKVFALQLNAGTPRLSEIHYWRTIIPCMKFEYLSSGYKSETNNLRAALKCTDSDWLDSATRLVFDLNGNSQDSYISDLYVPRYTINSKQLVLGMGNEDQAKQ